MSKPRKRKLGKIPPKETPRSGGNMEVSIETQTKLRRTFKGIQGQAHAGGASSRGAGSYRDDGSKKTKPPYGKRIRKQRGNK